MGRNLFVKDTIPNAGNMNFNHRKGEPVVQVSEPISETAYFQEDVIDVKINPEEEIKKYRFSAVSYTHLTLPTKA